jgi:hypothetical protein
MRIFGWDFVRYLIIIGFLAKGGMKGFVVYLMIIIIVIKRVKHLENFLGLLNYYSTYII